MKIYLIILLVLTISCKEKSKENNKVTGENNTVIQDSLKLNKNMLLEKSNADKIFGKPIKQERILLNELYGEFRGNIYYKYTEYERQHSSIYIEEITWEKDDKNYITIWYEIQNKKLIPKAYLIWDKLSEF